MRVPVARGGPSTVIRNRLRISHAIAAAQKSSTMPMVPAIIQAHSLGLRFSFTRARL